MKTAALAKLRKKLANDEPIYGFWVTLEAPSLTEIAVSLGCDWVVIDAEHGHLDWKEVAEHVRATVRSDTVALVRIGERNTVLTKRALDVGADGIIIPMVETLAELQEAVRDCRYPPEGRRGIGGERATVWGQALVDHTAEANDHVLIVPMIESVRTMEAVPAMCQTAGPDLFLFGPADFSASAGYRGQWEGPGVADKILHVKDQLRAAGKHCGVLCRSADDMAMRRSQGFRMLGLGSDTGLVFRSLRDILKAAGRDRAPATSLDPRDGTPVREVLPEPPAAMQPDRPAKMTPCGEGATFEIQPGVTLEALVGDFNTARNLTTGIVTFKPGVALDLHTHPCSESITVLSGQVEVAVEGRAYVLGPLDNLAIPRWVPHAVRNANASTPARLHVALAMSSPERTILDTKFERREMPADWCGTPGMERVTRMATAKRSLSVGPGAEFVDYFNAELMPGLEMSGGYGLFYPQGRLPAHVHDFDESICITSGTADCLVEGKRYKLGGCATAMVPRGRVHYFINESNAPMEMIWVYAGPMPERIVVDARCATEPRSEGK